MGRAASGLTPSRLSLPRLMEHEDDPDVDEPLETPLGHILGREPTSSEQVGPEGPDWETSCDSRHLVRAWENRNYFIISNNTGCLFVGSGSAAGESKPILTEEERQEQTKR